MSDNGRSASDGSPSVDAADSLDADPQDAMGRPSHLPRSSRLARSDLAFSLVVFFGYALIPFLAIVTRHTGADRMMVLAQQVLQGHLDSPTFAGTVDSVERSGRYYIAVGPLQVAPYLPFALVHLFQNLARYLVSFLPGVAAALLALPLARAYGARGAAAYWVAAFSAFGTLLLFVPVFGNFYWLAHAESFLALTVMLLEWAGRRRPPVLGILFGLSFLARPTTILAALPFAVALAWRKRDALRRLVALGVPIGVAGLIYAAFDWARFGSPIESGYAISLLHNPSLIARRAGGIFSIGQIAENIRLAFVQLPTIRRAFPFVIPSAYGQSMLLVSPGLLISLRAGFRDPAARMLWAAAGLVAIPIFLYYGGGYVQYGFRYSLDFTPFLVALTAMATRQRFGRLERTLFALSILFVAVGVIWYGAAHLAQSGAG